MFACRNHPESVKFSGDCAMEGNKKGNIVVINHTKWGALQHSAFLEENFDESGFNNRDVSVSSDYKRFKNELSASVMHVDLDNDDDDLESDSSLINSSVPNSSIIIID